MTEDIPAPLRHKPGPAERVALKAQGSADDAMRVARSAQSLATVSVAIGVLLAVAIVATIVSGVVQVGR